VGQFGQSYFFRRLALLDSGCGSDLGASSDSVALPKINAVDDATDAPYATWLSIFLEKRIR
jgi:hypothetical protein